MKLLLGALAGGLAGYGYYALIGCWTGTCWIGGDPWLSSAYFGVLGWTVSGGGRVLARLLPG